MGDAIKTEYARAMNSKNAHARALAAVEDALAALDYAALAIDVAAVKRDVDWFEAAKPVMGHVKPAGAKRMRRATRKAA
jgi:hypothetical protein